MSYEGRLEDVILYVSFFFIYRELWRGYHSKSFPVLYMIISYHVRERPFNLKGGYGFFLIKYSDSHCCWKKYSDFGGGKKIYLIQFLSYNLMLKSGEKKFALCATKRIIILTSVLSEKKILNETKNHKPPLQVKWSVPKVFMIFLTWSS